MQNGQSALLIGLAVVFAAIGLIWYLHGREGSRGRRDTYPIAALLQTWVVVAAGVSHGSLREVTVFAAGLVLPLWGAVVAAVAGSTWRAPALLIPGAVVWAGFGVWQRNAFFEGLAGGTWLAVVVELSIDRLRARRLQPGAMPACRQGATSRGHGQEAGPG
jgi:hypothetical protein